jgi:hypothetical protein
VPKFSFLDAKLDRSYVDQVMGFANSTSTFDGFKLVNLFGADYARPVDPPNIGDPKEGKVTERVTKETQQVRNELTKMLDSIIDNGRATRKVTTQIGRKIGSLNLLGTATF